MNSISVVPAGSLQPDMNALKSESSTDQIKETVCREFIEEILGKDEVEMVERYQKEDIDACLDTYFCTMGFDPLTTKMEMGIITLVRCDDDFRKSVSRLLPDMTFDGPSGLTKGDLEKLISHHSNEGMIELVEYSVDNVRRHENNKKAMPIFRQCMKYAKEHREEILSRMP